jgi:hypothetical protein
MPSLLVCKVSFICIRTSDSRGMTFLPSDIPDAPMGYIPKHENPDHNVSIRLSVIGGYGRD